MFASFRSHRPGRFASSAAAIAAFLAAGAALHTEAARAQGTHLWTQSRFEEFEKGTPQGVALGSDGRLRAGPGLSEVLTTPSTFVWSVAVGKDGTAYLGTGSPAAVLRVEKDGKSTTIFETKDLSVQAVRLGPDGALYAATMPSGRVYKLKTDAAAKQDENSATAVFDAGKIEDAAEATAGAAAAAQSGKAKEDAEKSDAKKNDSRSRFIWDLTFDAAGRLYVATGGPGAVYRVDTSMPGSRPELFFKSDEQHIRCMAWDAKGNLIAGSDGSGLVYRIDKSGKGYVLFEAPRREITAVAIGEKGTIYAASVGDKSHNPLPPLPVQGVGSVTITIVQPGSLAAANTSASLPDGSEIYELAPADDVAAQAPRKIWAGKDEVIYALAANKGGLTAVSGNRGRVFVVHDDGSYADVAHLDAQQGLSLAGSEETGGLLVGTGNTGKLYRLSAETGKHEYASDILDAGALARYGRVEVEPDSKGFELWTRTGNVEQPVRGWSDWEKPKNGQVASPAGRFLQWKAELAKDGSLGSVGVNYLPVNAAPVVDELVVVTGARLNAQNPIAMQPPSVSINFPSASQNAINFDGTSGAPLQAVKDRTAITARWSAHDDNGDDLTYSLLLRGDGENVWRLLKDGLTDKAYSFDATLIPDGGYRLKVVASDAPSHTPGEALTGEKESDRFEVDTTPPVVSGLKAAGSPARATFDAEDAFSPIAHAEYSVDAGPWQFVEPVGGLSDSRIEHYALDIPAKLLDAKNSEHLITVRVYDRHDNVGVAKAVFEGAGK